MECRELKGVGRCLAERTGKMGIHQEIVPMEDGLRTGGSTGLEHEDVGV